MSTLWYLFSVFCLIYCICIAIINIKANYKHDVSKSITILSYICSILLFISVITSTLSHHIPIINNYCLCKPLFIISLLLYIISIFLMKFVYLQRMRIFNKQPILQSKIVKYHLWGLFIYFLITMIICLYTLLSYSHGQCIAISNNLKNFICHNRVEFTNIYIAFGFIAIDSILFILFCYRWYSILGLLKLSENNDNQIPKKALAMFMTQLILTIIAMSSCIIDGLLYYFFMNNPNYSQFLSMSFRLDCLMVSSSNFASLKYSQQLLIQITSKIFYVCQSRKKTDRKKNIETQNQINRRKETVESIGKLGITSDTTNDTPLPSPLSHRPSTQKVPTISHTEIQIGHTSSITTNYPDIDLGIN